MEDVEEEEEPGRKRRVGRVDFVVVTGLSELALASRSVGDSRSDPEAAVGGRISLLLRFTKELNVVHELLREALDKGAFWEMGLLEPFVGGSLFLDFVRRSMESGFEFWGKDDQLSLLLRFEVVMRRGKRRAEEGGVVGRRRLLTWRCGGFGGTRVWVAPPEGKKTPRKKAKDKLNRMKATISIVRFPGRYEVLQPSVIQLGQSKDKTTSPNYPLLRPNEIKRQGLSKGRASIFTGSP